MTSMRSSTVNLELKTPGELLDEIVRLRKGVQAAYKKCADICDECHVQDDRDNGAAATGAAGMAAERIRRAARASTE